MYIDTKKRDCTVFIKSVIFTNGKIRFTSDKQILPYEGIIYPIKYKVQNMHAEMDVSP